jgi:2-polyprenyl-6-methoxyphenol hydroxylase-like FAD-dependent oxidoreductase
MISDVVIAGAGIGGLTLAVALKRRGVRVTLLEREAELRPAGAGLALSPNAVVALKQLDLADAALGVGAVINRSAILDAAGRPLGAEIDAARLARDLGAPIVALHRARLHEVLLHAVGRDTVRQGMAISRYEQDTDRVAVFCSNGARMDTSLLVGADGLRSTVRAQLVGDGEPVYAGYTSWRGVTPAGAVPTPSRMTESWGHGERFGIVDIGFGQIYWFAVATAAPGGSDGDVRRELLSRFAGWHEPVRAIIEATPAAQILRTDISDRRPIHRWHEGRVVLLGDAAHPMTPNLGQGAGQAIEDAVVLGRCLANADEPGAALGQYERLRIARANSIVRGSRALGAVGQLRNPVAVWLRNTAMRLTPASLALAQARRVMRSSPA